MVAARATGKLAGHRATAAVVEEPAAPMRRDPGFRARVVRRGSFRMAVEVAVQGPTTRPRRRPAALVPMHCTSSLRAKAVVEVVQQPIPWVRPPWVRLVATADRQVAVAVAVAREPTPAAPTVVVAAMGPFTSSSSEHQLTSSRSRPRKYSRAEHDLPVR